MSPDKHTLDALRIDRTKAPARSLPIAWIVGFIVVLGLAAAGFWWVKRPRPIVVRTLIVRNEPAAANGVPTLLNASGYVTARREATISSKITGKVVEVLIEEGMEVEADQVLARLDSSNVEKNLHLAQAQLESARQATEETRALVVQAERELRRLERLARENAASQIELDRAETEFKSLQARIDRQEADVAVNDRQVALWKQEVDDTVIRAPFRGVVTSKNAQPGEMISPVSAGGGFTRTGICTIVDMSSLEIEVDVNESYINRVQAGQPAEAVLDSYPQWKIPAEVIAIIPTADRQKATVKVRVGFTQLDSRILPDMSVKVAFQSTERVEAVASGLSIPSAAVYRHDGRDVVWIVREGRVERRAVTLGAANGDAVAVAAGLSAGERIVVEGGEQLSDGARVTEENS